MTKSPSSAKKKASSSAVKKDDKVTSAKAAEATKTSEKPAVKPDPKKAKDGVSAKTSTPASRIPETKPSTIAATPTPSHAGPGTGIAFSLAILVLIGVGAGFTWQHLWPYVEPMLPRTEAENARLTNLQDRLAALEEKINAGDGALDGSDQVLEKLQSERDRMSIVLTTAMERLEAVEDAMETTERMALAISPALEGEEAQNSLNTLITRLDTIESSTRDRANSHTGRLDEINRRVHQLEERTTVVSSGVSARASALLLAVGQLRTTIRNAAPYGAELKAVREALGDDADATIISELTVMSEYASTGVSSKIALRSTYEGAALSALRARDNNGGGGVLDSAINSISSLVSIRKVGEAIEPGSLDEKIAMAEQALDSHNLAGTIAILETLTGPEAVAFEPWLSDAKHHMNVERAVTSLSNSAALQLSGSQG